MKISQKEGRKKVTWLQICNLSEQESKCDADSWIEMFSTPVRSGYEVKIVARGRD